MTTYIFVVEKAGEFFRNWYDLLEAAEGADKRKPGEVSVILKEEVVAIGYDDSDGDKIAMIVGELAKKAARIISLLIGPLTGQRTFLPREKARRLLLLLKLLDKAGQKERVAVIEELASLAEEAREKLEEFLNALLVSTYLEG